MFRIQLIYSFTQIMCCFYSFLYFCGLILLVLPYSLRLNRLVVGRINIIMVEYLIVKQIHGENAFRMK